MYPLFNLHGLSYQSLPGRAFIFIAYVSWNDGALFFYEALENIKEEYTWFLSHSLLLFYSIQATALFRLLPCPRFSGFIRRTKPESTHSISSILLLNGLNSPPLPPMDHFFSIPLQRPTGVRSPEYSQTQSHFGP